MGEYFRRHKLRIVEFNVENLFLYLDLYQGEDLGALSESQWQKLSISTIPNKALVQVRQIAHAIRTMDPDILMLCEVGGRESLANFSRYFLNGEYQDYLIEGNSDRGIDLGYLVRKNLPYRFELHSHRDREIDFLYPHEKLSRETGYKNLRSARLTSHKFSRDVLELQMYEGDEPVLICLLVHLKSQLDRARMDPQGRDRRRAELEKLVKIYGEIGARTGAPVILGGDFNGRAGRHGTDLEFEALYRETDLEDCLEVAGIPVEERFTHMQIQGRRHSSNKQLDYIFVPPSLHARVNRDDTWVFRYQDETGRTLILPRNFNEKRNLPSDHYPVILTINPEEDV